MKKLLYVIGALFLLIFALFAALPFLLSAETIQAKIIETVKDKTGRDLTIEGGTSLSFFPSIALTANNVALSNPPRMAKGEMMRVNSLKLKLKLMPLLDKRVEVDEFILKRPIIALAVDKQGQANWEFGTIRTAPEDTDAPAEKQPALADSDAADAIMPQDIKLGDIRIEDGVLGYADARSGARHMVKAISISLKLPSLAGPLQAKGSFNWNGRPVNVETSITSLSAIMENTFSPASLAVAAKGLEVNFDGEVTVLNGLQAEGKLSMKADKVRDIAGWLGAKLPTKKGFGPLAIKSRVGWTGSTLRLNGLSLALDKFTAEGSALVKTGGTRPEIEATLAADVLDLNNYLDSNGGGSGKGAGNSARNNAGGSGWSKSPIDLSGLGALDADLRLSLSQLIHGKIKIGKSALAVILRGGILKANLGELNLYGGQASGRFTIRGGKRRPSFAASLNAKGVSALPFFKAVADFDWISGNTALSLNLAGQGNNQRQMVNGLSGKGQFNFANGAIEGINIAGMVRNLKKGALSGWKRSPKLKTDFAVMSGSFQITKGRVSNPDLKLAGPLVRLDADGIVDLPGQALDYHAEPKIVGSLKGQGGKSDLAGLVLPVRITGPWAKPKIKPDLKRLLEDPDKILKNVKTIKKSVKKLGRKAKKYKKLFKSLKQGDSKDLLGGAVDGEPAENDPVGGLLNNLFGK